MTEQELLTKARARIADPDHWTTKVYAVGSLSHSVHVTSPDATAWCALGSLRCECELARVPARLEADATWILQECATEVEPLRHGITYVNDILGHDAVMKMYDCAIEKAGDRG